MAVERLLKINGDAGNPGFHALGVIGIYRSKKAGT
jgi:hypothetical protein